MTPILSRLSLLIPFVVILVGLLSAAMTSRLTLMGVAKVVEAREDLGAQAKVRFLAREASANLREGRTDAVQRLFATASVDLSLDRIILLDQTGAVLLASHPEDAGSPRDAPAWMGDFTAIKALARGRDLAHLRNGSMIAAAMTLLAASDPGRIPTEVGYVVVKSDLTPALSQARSSALITAAMQAFVAVILAAALAFLLARRLGRRANMLTGAADSLGTEAFVMENLPSGRDEIGQISEKLQGINAQLLDTMDMVRWEQGLSLAVMDQSHQAMALCELDGRVVRVNRSFSELCRPLAIKSVVGSLLRELLSRTFDDLGADALETFKKAPPSPNGEGASRLVSSGLKATPRFFLASLTPVLDSAGAEIALLFEARDVTEREELLMDSKLRRKELAQALAHAKLGAWTYRPDQGLIELTSEARAIFGEALPWTMKLRDAFRFVLPADRGRFRAWLAQTDSFPKAALRGLRLTDLSNSNGLPLALDIQLAPVTSSEETSSYMGLVQDASERTQAEWRGRELDWLVRSLTEHVPGLVYRRVLAASGAVSYPIFRGRLLDRFGLEEEGLSLGDLLPVLHEEDQDLMKKFVRRADIGSSAAEFRAVDSSGEVLWLRAQVHQRRGEGGDLISDGIMTDITELKAAEDLVARTRQMEAVGQLAGGIAHDFNNLLAILSGNVELMEMDLEAGRPMDPNNLNAIAGTVKRAAAVTGRLLEFSREEPGEARVVDAVQEVLSFMQFFAGMLGQGMELQPDFRCEEAWIEVNPEELHNALINLVGNARDACGPGSTLTLEVDIRSEVLPEQEDGGLRRLVAISVVDQGEGMDAETRKRALTPFFTSKPMGKGTGLGLPTVVNFCATHGGEFTLDSVPGEGTRATMEFPLVKDALRDRRQTSSPWMSPIDPSSRILLVEDEDSLRELLRRCLVERGFQVHVESDGRGALAALDKGGFDVLITDLMMPGGIGGEEIIEKARGIQADFPVVVMSGYSESMEGLKQDPSLVFMRKPFAISEFLDAVAMARPLAKGGR